MSNLLGPRSAYLYTDDTGATYSVVQDDDLAAAVGNVLNDSNPSPPQRFKKRVVYVEDASGNRKAVWVGALTAAAYASNASTTVTIDGDEWKTTGRKGEQASFVTN